MDPQIGPCHGKRLGDIYYSRLTQLSLTWGFDGIRPPPTKINGVGTCEEGRQTSCTGTYRKRDFHALQLAQVVFLPLS
jgi:hypothetical protein